LIEESLSWPIYRFFPPFHNNNRQIAI